MKNVSQKKQKKKSHRIPFNPSKQHAINTNLIIECTECNKPRTVCAQKTISAGRVRTFKRVTHDLLFVYGSSVEKLVGPENFKDFHIRRIVAIAIQSALPSSLVEQMSTLFAVIV